MAMREHLKERGVSAKDKYILKGLRTSCGVCTVGPIIFHG